MLISFHILLFSIFNHHPIASIIYCTFPSPVIPRKVKHRKGYQLVWGWYNSTETRGRCVGLTESPNAKNRRHCRCTCVAPVILTSSVQFDVEPEASSAHSPSFGWFRLPKVHIRDNPNWFTFSLFSSCDPKLFGYLHSISLAKQRLISLLLRCTIFSDHSFFAF